MSAVGTRGSDADSQKRTPHENMRHAPAKPLVELANADEGDDQDEDEDEDEDENTLEPTDSKANGTSAAQSARQRKKKKSKAAARVKKKLGIGNSESNDKGNSSGKVSAQVLSDEQVKQLQDAVEKEQGPMAASKVDRQNLEKLMQMMNLERDAMLQSQESKQKAAKAIADHKFWKTQPVTKPGDAPLRSNSEEGPIEANVPPEKVKQEPYPLPKDFEWVTIDIDDPEQLKEVYDLLSANYVEDDDASLRFNYSPEFLNWVLRHPGYNKNWHIGVRVNSTKKLVAFISGIPHEIRVRDQSYHSTEINFLCVHKKLRAKRLAPVLIKEVTRQCHLTGVFQAIYTVGAVLPTPISCARYYHRTINAEKLLDIGFSAMPQGMSKERFLARYALPSNPQTPHLREMAHKDVPMVARLMRRYMRRFDMAARFSDREVAHLMLSGKGEDDESGKRVKQVTWTYVVDDPAKGRITDVFSFYSLPSSVLDNSNHKVLEAAYLFYYATDVPFQNESRDFSAPGESSTTASVSTPGQEVEVPQWQRSSITGLSPKEMEDETEVTTWEKEDPVVKRRLKERLNVLMQDLLILAKQEGFDVVNCLTVMDNQLFLNEQKFGPGDGFLRFYLFNWRVQPIAGGMGNRAGETELDPVVQYRKTAAARESNKGKLTDSDIQQALESRPRADLGSGNGIVMV